MFKKYIHLERITSEEVQGLFDEACYVLPKLDGANASIWHDGTKICCGSRNNQLDSNNTLQGFYGWVQENENIATFFCNFPSATLYGEWLVPHTIKGYLDDAWKNFYAFDILINDAFIDHSKVEEVCYLYGIKYVAAIEMTTPGYNFDYDALLTKCKWWLSKEDDFQHEGLVFKRHNFINKFGRTTYGKYVPISLKEIGKERKGIKLNSYAEGIESAIIHDFLTENLLDKEIAKIKLERGFSTLDPKLLGESLGRIWHALITEEIFDILKKFKNPVIDFKLLKQLSDQKVKIKFGI